MEKVKITIIVSTDDANATARATKEYLQGTLEEEFFFESDGDIIDSIETEILEEN